MTASWSTPSDFAVAHIVTAAEWNAMNGASGNGTYLHTNFPSVTTGGARVFDTAYQNTTVRTMIADIGMQFYTNTTAQIQAYTYGGIGAAASTLSYNVGAGITGLAASTGTIGANMGIIGSFSLTIPPLFYYSVSTHGTGSTTLIGWAETLLGGS